ncbi:beta-1,4 N-acetylgalactosaminyltransferase 1 isoform X1 [Danio rerio]|uniref:Beta-1,4 N-acetylgalactosaminyltransferase 1 n=3 Tax=Danio rerio TaxID=7955 RepID=F1R3L0_DANRE|nr:beta-1,4 N-acetylgalactosaminyltransferase 1 [Danio rerio]|eukprot:XP_686341.3 beta-1,4 N-acetylgalactosaminyltransferase 1 [Danio rerio]
MSILHRLSHMMKVKNRLKVVLVLMLLSLLIFLFIQSEVFDRMPTFRASPEHDMASRLNITCEGADLTRQFVPKDQLNDLLERREKEYKQSKLRVKTDADILIAPANSPLQYPITGFRVVPLKKSMIPGLALRVKRTSARTNSGQYKVSLSVMSGVLSVEDVQDGQQVDGQGQSELTISSSNLTQLNDLLSRVSYTSTVYHIRTSDLACLSFEDHEAKFPIMIRRPTVPVLYDPGEDINSQVTILTKTFLRYKELNVLIESIRKFYPKIKIIIADDSLNPERVSGDNIEHFIMPPAQGWFAGRNLAVSQLTTKYFLWVDDDFEFLHETRIESFVEIMEAVPDLDVIGGEVSGDQFYFLLEYEEGAEHEGGGCLRRVRGEFHQPLSGFDGCHLVDGVTNYFLARTEAVRRVGFDPFLKRVGHTEFFIDGLGKLLVATCKGFCIGHQTHQTYDSYESYRNQEKEDEKRKLAHHFFKNYLNCIKY